MNRLFLKGGQFKNDISKSKDSSTSFVKCRLTVEKITKIQTLSCIKSLRFNSSLFPIFIDYLLIPSVLWLQKSSFIFVCALGITCTHQIHDDLMILNIDFTDRLEWKLFFWKGFMGWQRGNPKQDPPVE